MSNPKSLSDRLNFLNLGPQAQARLRGMKSVVMSALPGALDTFYAKMRSVPETAKFFPNEALMRHAKGKQHGHWDLITDGQLDERYAQAVTHVGEVHARIGLEPRWYIGGYTMVLERLIGALIAARWPKSRFGRPTTATALTEEIATLVRVTFLDMDMAISVYLDACETRRREAEEQAHAAAQGIIAAMDAAATALAKGDLTHRVGDNIPPQYAQLRTSFNDALEKLSRTMVELQATSHAIDTSIDDIAAAADDMSRRTEGQAASLEQSTAALNELTAAVRQTAEGAAQVSNAVKASNAGAAESHNVVTEAGSAMGQIEGSSREIGKIIGLIDEIAFQTNLLALNAGVEAARAGDAGRGFAVVASEVRALAQRSADAAKAIKTLISTSSAQVEQGVDLVRRSGQSLKGIGSNITEIDELVSGIAGNARSQSAGLAQVNEAVAQMSHAVQQNAAMVEETNASIHSLRGEIVSFNRAIAAFKLAQAPASRQSPPAAIGEFRELVS
ncbi:globin-coupled sensor protein [Acidocella aromatica]|uniref:Methyl-accepting chemotaxis protein n=1 Tax=Acidocella aromatica TaxID=1303579 RepID=A0A840VEA9_9PROT|nr:globin-coupled sensor protein [Acidocella aromatica]MBB5374074.1 methyl-accepting chemotaxis protein [Acidocella aromatica]